MDKPHNHSDEKFFQRHRRRVVNTLGNDKIQELSRKQRDQKLEIDRWAEKYQQQ